MGFKPTGNRVFLSIDRSKEDQMVVGGKTLFIDPVFDEWRHATNWGIIKYCPQEFTKNYIQKYQLMPGMKVYGHHFLRHDDNRIVVESEELYMSDYSQLYCVADGDSIVMLEDYLFIEAITEAEENYKTKSGIWLKPEAETVRQEGIITHLSSHCRVEGLNVGDHVFFGQHDDYKMKVEGKEYYRMRLDDIMGVFQKQEVC